jgi:hypothetical protein
VQCAAKWLSAFVNAPHSPSAIIGCRCHIAVRVTHSPKLLLGKEAADLAKQVQKSGRPRDFAEERWILELADIYEIAFAAKPRIWGSGTETVKRRGRFYDLLMVSRPLSFPQHDKLSPSSPTPS